MSPEFRERRRSLLLTVLKVLLLLSFIPGAFGQTGQPPATIMLNRHAEKLTDGRTDYRGGTASLTDLPQGLCGAIRSNLAR